MKRYLSILALSIGLALVPVTALAYGVHTGSTVDISGVDTVNGTQYVSGSSVTITGPINGDLICAGATVVVRGPVHGDVICAGQNVTVDGPVDGSVRIAGQNVTLDGSVGRNVTILAQALTATRRASVTGDFGALGGSVIISGAVGQNVYGQMGELGISSSVGSVDVQASRLSLGPHAHINGDLNYTGARKTSYRSGIVGGQAHYHFKAPQRAISWFRVGLALRVIWTLGLTLLGIVLIWLIPAVVTRISQLMLGHPGRSLGLGAVGLVLTPPLAILLVLSLIGLPLAMLTVVVWIMLLVLSQMFAGIAAGQWTLRRLGVRRHALPWSALGVPILGVLFAMPFLGLLAGILAACWTIGGTASAMWRLRS